MKKVVLGFFPYKYFKNLANALEGAGYEVVWLFTLKSDFRGFELSSSETNQRARYYSGEYAGTRDEYPLLTSNRFVLSDRYLMRLNKELSQKYQSGLERFLTDFLCDIGEESIILTWRDVSPQITLLTLSNLLGKKCYVPTRARLPHNYYGLTVAIETNSFVELDNQIITEENWAVNVLNQYREGTVKPELKIATTRLNDILKLAPFHLSEFIRLLKISFIDRGNRFNRYSMAEIVVRYIKRKLNLFNYLFFPPYHKNELPKDLDYYLYMLHTQPESSIDVQAQKYSNQKELIKRIAICLRGTERLVVKIHPTDIDGHSLKLYNDIASMPGVILVKHSLSSFDLIKNSKLIFTLTGSVGIEAAFMNKKVVTFIDNFYNFYNTVYYCENISNLEDFIERVNQDVPDDNIIESLQKFKSKLVRGAPSRVYGADISGLTSADLNTYINLVNYLHRDI